MICVDVSPVPPDHVTRVGAAGGGTGARSQEQEHVPAVTRIEQSKPQNSSTLLSPIHSGGGICIQWF